MGTRLQEIEKYANMRRSQGVRDKVSRGGRSFLKNLEVGLTVLNAPKSLRRSSMTRSAFVGVGGKLEVS